MRPLGAGALLRLWEEAEDRNRPAEYALALLEAVADGDERDALGALTIGARDARLLELRARTFGDLLQAQTRCAACGEQLEFSISAGDLLAPRAGAAREEEDGWRALECAGWRLRFRLPRARDLLEPGRIVPPRDLRRALLERCVDGVRHGDSPASVAQLPEEIVSALAARMEELDPCADILLALGCTRCGGAWHAPFDIVAYLRAELGTHARRLLREVASLVRTYGWREADILAMSSRRRRAYLELAEA